MQCLCWYPYAHMFLCLFHQVISWRERRKAPPDGQSSTLMCMNQRHMRPKGWLKASYTRWGCLLSTALACLSPVSTLNPLCQLVGNAAASALSIWTSVGPRFFSISLSVTFSPDKWTNAPDSARCNGQHMQSEVADSREDRSWRPGWLCYWILQRRRCEGQLFWL